LPVPERIAVFDNGGPLWALRKAQRSGRIEVATEKSIL
jgi:hypothetical protein